jgi:gluconolactonase
MTRRRVSIRGLALLAALATGSALFAAAPPPATPLPATATQPLCVECRFEKFATCGGFLEGASVDAQGGLWVVDLLGGRVLSVADDGKCTERANTGGQPNGARFGPDGQLWIADKQLGLLRVDPRSGAITPVVATYRTERLRGLNDLAFDKAGGVYFTEPYGSSALKPDGRLFYLPPGPQAHLQVVSEGLAFPNGVLVTPSGNNVWVGEYARKRVLSIPAVGSPDEFDVAHVVALTEGGIGPDGMLLLPDGRLVAAIFNAGELAAFSPRGHALGRARLPPEAGIMTTNVTLRGEWLYVTEGSRGEIWRVRLGR